MLVAFLFAALLAGADQAAQRPGESGGPPPPLTLKDAIALAQRDAPAHIGAAAVASGASDAARLAGRLPNPLLDIRTENWSPSAASALPLDVWATISQPFELGGKRDIRRGLAAAERDSAAAGLVLVDRQLALHTTQLYFQALRARGLLVNLAANRDGVATLVETMRHRVTEGYVAESDLLRFEAEAARLDIDIARATLDLARSLDALTAVAGAERRIEAGQLAIPDQLPVPAADSTAIAAAIARHPEMTAASARLVHAEQTAALERARRLPDPSFTTGYKRTLGVSTVVAAMTATVPLFDRNGAARAVAAGNVRAVSAERDAVRARLTSEATSLTRAATTLAERAARADQDLLQPAGIVREAARAAFREGSVDVLKLIDAERVYGEVLRAALDLRLEAIASAIEARIALGEEPLP